MKASFCFTSEFQLLASSNVKAISVSQSEHVIASNALSQFSNDTKWIFLSSATEDDTWTPLCNTQDPRCLSKVKLSFLFETTQHRTTPLHVNLKWEIRCVSTRCVVKSTQRPLRDQTHQFFHAMPAKAVNRSCRKDGRVCISTVVERIQPKRTTPGNTN